MQSQKSFTVIELLVVIAIIGLIASIILVNIDLPAQRQRAKIAKTLEFSQSIQSALGAEAVGIWNFDNNALDSSGYGKNGTVYGGASFTDDTPQKVIGQGTGKYALSFNGVDGYVIFAQILPTSKTTPFTFSAWTKPSIATGWKTIIGTDGSYAQIGFSSSGNIIFGQNGGGGWWLLGPTASVGRWYYIVGTFDGTNASLYVDGELKAGPTAKSFISNHGVSVVGRYSPTTGEWMNGLIDEVRIYSQALTMGQIQKHYAEGLAKYYGEFSIIP